MRTLHYVKGTDYRVMMYPYSGSSYQVGKTQASETAAERIAVSFLRHRVSLGGMGPISKLKRGCWELEDNGRTIGDYDGTLRVENVCLEGFECRDCGEVVVFGCNHDCADCEDQ